MLTTYRLMELRRNEPDFLLSVVQMIRSLKRNRERSFFPPTVFCRVQMMTRRHYISKTNTKKREKDAIHPHIHMFLLTFVCLQCSAVIFVTLIKQNAILHWCVSIGISWQFINCDNPVINPAKYHKELTVVWLMSTSYRLHDHFLSYELPLGIQNLKK